LREEDEVDRLIERCAGLDVHCGPRWCRPPTPPPGPRTPSWPRTTSASRAAEGTTRAIIAVAHSILVIVWHLLTGNQPYSDLGGDYFLERHHSQAYKNRLVRQLQRMGHMVTLEPLGTA
jgi:hypothetical protein